MLVRSAQMNGSSGREVGAKLDLFAEDAAEHSGEVGDEPVQVQHTRPHDLAAAEGEELPREVGGALRGLLDLFERLGEVGAQSGHRELEAGVALDDGEQVVEVVRDAGGELPDGFHFLRLPELRLELEAVGNVLRHDEQMRLSVEGDVLDGNEHVAQVAAIGADLRHGVADGADAGERIIEDDSERKFDRCVADEALAGEAGHRGEGDVDIDEAALRQRLDGEGDGAGEKGCGKARLGAAQFGIREFHGGGALLDHQIEHLDAKVRLLRDDPLLRQRVGELEHLDVVEGLLEDHEVFVHAEARAHFLPRVIGIGGANDDLQGGIDVPQLLDRLDAVPTRGHAHIDERKRVGLLGSERPPHELQRLLPLKCGIQIESACERGGRFRCIENHGFDRFERGVACVRSGEDFSEVFVDRRIVVHYQNARAGRCHASWA